MRMIMAYSFLAAGNETLWTRNSEQGNIHDGDYGIGYSGDFVMLVGDFYRLEYTYSMLKNKPFSGMERRKDVILERVQETFQEVSLEMKEIFEGVFSKWLRGHAIMNPQQWAQARIYDAYAADGSFENVVNGFFDEFVRYKNNGIYPTAYNVQQMRRNWQNDFLQRLFEDPRAINAFKDVMGEDIDSLKEVDREMLKSDWKSNPESFEEENSLQPELSEEEIDVEIERMLQEKFDTPNFWRDYAENMKYEELMSFFENTYDEDAKQSLLVSIGATVVFPLWFGYWRPRGIEQTRENVQNAYNGLIAAESLGDIFAAVNVAINTSHQSGSMLQYVEEAVSPDESLKDLFNEMTQGNFTEEVNTTLRQVGVQI
ncbi:MAG: hypothetical protein WC511_02310 [Candidatus Pacearchaeota archaeon]